MSSENETNAGSAFGKDVSAGIFRNGLVCLVLFGLMVRLGFLVEHARSPSFGVLTLDQKYYDTAARLILHHEDLSQLHGFRPLLYPVFLAVTYKLGGAHGIDMAVLVQHFLGVFTGVLVALLGARLFRHRLCGLAGGLLYLLAPIPLYFEGELLIESSYVFLICLGLLLVLQAAEAAGRKAAVLWLLGGGMTVLTAQARPNILVFMAVYPLMAAWRWWHSRPRGAWWPLLGLIGGLIMAIPWGFVNKKQLGRFEILPAAGGVNLYLGNKRTADGMAPEQERRVTYGERYEDSGEIWAREEYIRAMHIEARQPETDPMAVSRYWTGRAIQEIESAPLAWLHLMAKKCWLMFWNMEVPNNKAFAFLRTEFVWLRVMPVRWVVLLMLAPAGIWAAAKFGNRGALFVLLTYIVLYSASDVAFFVCDRYRYPLWPVMAAIGGGGWLAFVETIRLRQTFLSLGLAGAMAVMALVSLPNWFGAHLPTFARDYLFRSIAWYEKGRFEQALTDVNQSLLLDPWDITAIHHRANILLALKRFNEARQDYERILKSDLKDGGVWNDYGLALEHLDRGMEALAAFRNATQCDPPSKNAYFGMAFEELHENRADEAARAMDALDKLEKRPDAMALAIRSIIARRRGDLRSAAALESHARKLDAAATDWALQQAAPPRR